MLMRRIALSAATLLALSACDSPAAPLPEQGRPGVLSYSGGGFGIGTGRLELRGDTVVLIRTPWDLVQGTRPDTVRTVPTPEAWRAFWRAADDAGVRRWRPEYRAENIVDGYGWSLRLRAGAARVQSSGSNAYPDRRGREHTGDFTPEFSSFRAALETLVGAPLLPR